MRYFAGSVCGLVRHQHWMMTAVMRSGFRSLIVQDGDSGRGSWNSFAGESHLSPTVLRELDRSTDQTLERIESPLREGSWDRRGLVVGHVQSGKTTHYTSVIAKALDAGYQIVIVLAGIHKSLRSQTHGGSTQISSGLIVRPFWKQPGAVNARPPEPQLSVSVDSIFNEDWATCHSQS